jgi:hypothetical protein
MAAQFFNWYCEKNFTFFNKDHFKDNELSDKNNDKVLDYKLHRTVYNKKVKDSLPISYNEGIEKNNDTIYYAVMAKFKKLDVNKQTQLEFILTHLKV